MIRCILFDRDGTLGELTDKRYPQTFHPYCNIANIFQQLKNKGYIVGIISNQSSIARGTGLGYDFESEFKSYGADIWEICPHDNKDHCDCRKPKSGMLLSVCKKLNLHPEECLVIGDRLSDVQCAKNVGSKAIFVLTGFGEIEKIKILQEYPGTPYIQKFDEILNITI